MKGEVPPQDLHIEESKMLPVKKSVASCRM
jgi:hypothetical protein